ncbi:translation initiation factor IF-1 [Candidatus Peregrinibacteria bacterium CG_4_9_14_0_2_um_filter_53_11]|nr:MAG: translation initiation factor IF-1 [Candidatus Peregrinibacteria bacterium CG_4_9_14_0_2_um_filter_53_11]
MPKGNKIAVDGIVTEMLPNATFMVRITDEQFPSDFIVRGYIAGKMRMNYIRIIPGDTVRIELDPLDVSKGRIVYRYKAPQAPRS